MLKKLELSYDDHIQLIKHCNLLGLEFLTTAFDLKSLEIINSFDLKRIKVPSGEITNLPYLREIGKMKKQTIVSTGMSDLGDISNCLNVLTKNGTNIKKISVLHCTSEYPAPSKDLNLNCIPLLANAFDINVGYSDHSLGIEASIAAVTLGAKIIEKHFTLDKNLIGPDHSASINPDELKRLVSSIRNVRLV